MAQLVTLVNRTSKPLQGTWDGFHTQIAPGKHSFPVFQAEAYRRQNPIMGSEDPRTGEMQYLVGIEEQGDDCTPIEQSKAIERWDRSLMSQSKPTEVVPGVTGIYSARDVAQTLPSDTNFVKA